MIPTIAHVYGPFYIQSYGLFISLGLSITLWLANRDPQRKNIINDDQFITIILWGIAAALIGGRMLYILTSWNTLETVGEIFYLWQGGFSILGSIIGVLCIITWYAKKNLLPLAAILDFFAAYAPLIQSISRIGCFFAGCCYGTTTTNFLGITYNHPASMAPCGIALHPTQLYSAITLFGIFLVLQYLKRKITLGSGMITALYLMMVSLERFFLDFLRGDQEFLSTHWLGFFSLHQWLSLLIFLGSLGYFSFVAYTKHYESI